MRPEYPMTELPGDIFPPTLTEETGLMEFVGRECPMALGEGSMRIYVEDDPELSGIQKG